LVLEIFFKANYKIQHAIWVFMVSNLVSSEEKRNLMALFKTLDVNGDGQITKEELIMGYYFSSLNEKFHYFVMKGYKKIMKVPDPETEVEKIMKIVDLNNSGVIDYMG